MPIPIKPVHSLDLHAELFDGPSMEGLGLSDIQIQLLGMSNNNTKEASKISSRYLDMLKQIDANLDPVVTAANALSHNKEAKTFNVPNEITDNDLFALKTSGLVSGHGRNVTLTDKAKLALRDHYLSQDTTNEFRKARTKEKFDLEAARNVKTSNAKFKKVASWLTKEDDFRDEIKVKFDIRFIADDHKSRKKGLMNAKPLEKMEVVYFIFDSPDCYGFWNKNVDFPLSLAFLDKDSKIVDIKDLQANSERSIYPKSNNVVFVVEAYKGIFEKLNINIGDKLIVKGNNLFLSKK